MLDNEHIVDDNDMLYVFKFLKYNRLFLVNPLCKLTERTQREFFL